MVFFDSIIPFFLGAAAPWEWLGKGSSIRTFIALDEDCLSSFSEEKNDAEESSLLPASRQVTIYQPASKKALPSRERT